MTNNRTEQGSEVGYKKPPKHTQFGQPGGNPRNNGGIPKYVREVREELKGLLDPNLTMEDYQSIVESAESDSGLRAVFAEAVVKKDVRTIIELINQAWGKPKESMELSNPDGNLTPTVRIIDERTKD